MEHGLKTTPAAADDETTATPDEPTSVSTTDDVLVAVRSDISELHEYKPLSMDELVKICRRPKSDLVKLDANENNFGPLPAVQEAFSENAKSMHVYPDAQCKKLREAIGLYLTRLNEGSLLDGGGPVVGGGEKVKFPDGSFRPRTKISPQMIAAGSGSDENIDFLLRLFRPDVVVTMPPTFSMYGVMARSQNVPNVVEVPRDEKFAIDFEKLDTSISEAAKNVSSNDEGRSKPTILVFFCSPNNPTGNREDLKNVIRVLQHPAQPIVVLDDAYGEFGAAEKHFFGKTSDSCEDESIADQQASSLDLLGFFSNLIILRTFSKWAGLAGLRIGYSVSSPALAAMIREKIKLPFNLSCASEAAAIAACENAREIFHQQLLPILTTRRSLESCFAGSFTRSDSTSESTTRLVLAYEGGHINWLFLKLLGAVAGAMPLVEKLRDEFGIIVRGFSGQLAAYMRVSMGTPAEMQRFVDAMRQIFPGDRVGVFLHRKCFITMSSCFSTSIAHRSDSTQLRKSRRSIMWTNMPRRNSPHVVLVPLSRTIFNIDGTICS